MQKTLPQNQSSRERVITAVNTLDHILPGQAPILDFVHHNTLHGFQHLPFEEALTTYEELTGICGYLPEAQNREFFQQGRITNDNLATALARHTDLQTEQIICSIQETTIQRKDIYTIALLFDLEGINISQLNWQIEEFDALNKAQTDIPPAVRNQLFANNPHQPTVIKQLWQSILNKLDLQQAALHPEALLDLSVEHTEEWLAAHQAMLQQETSHHHSDSVALDELFAQLGSNITFRGLILKLSGVDILDSVRPQLIRICASAMDEGIAPWQLPDRKQLGPYNAWRTTVIYDANPFLHDLPDWQQIMSELPEDAIDAIILQLTQLEIPQIRWEGYLQKLALELPGWSGIINWRQHHSQYKVTNDTAPTLVDYLAIRLTLDRLWLNQICMDIWKIPAKSTAIKSYFQKNLSEFTVRQFLYQGNLPEYLVQQAESLTIQADPDRHNRNDWRQLAELIWTWQCSALIENNTGHTAQKSGWRLFRLCQHLGLNSAHLEAIEQKDLLAMLTLLDAFNINKRNEIWLYAYELNYRESFFQALHANHNRGRWAKRNKRPKSQIIFCMDDREEGFRRHLEELNPTIETLGAAGFFGIAMNYKGLDDSKITALCPVAVTPTHEVQEIGCGDNDKLLKSHHRGRKLNQLVANFLQNGLRRNLISSHPIIDAIAPLALLGLLAKSLLPKYQQGLLADMAKWQSPEVKTRLAFTSTDHSTIASANHPKLGFTDNEQVARVAELLRNIGLTYGFSELVVLMGHGSMSQNNPHLAAYDCGACSGRHGGPNARVFAAMANRPEIRKQLAECGINIPVDTWFIGAEHNTCTEAISWLDLTDIPKDRLAGFKKLQLELRHAQLMSAHERCRRLASAPRKPTPKEALAHIEERASDFSQARPELGHATNASAVVGRRSITQGAFFDRRVFLISYDPTQDADGKILEGILLAVAPVGAGINLEYYFSTINNERLGCGSKVTHNITGLFGVMEGGGSDLRTGLPQQMVEIHEAMRLQLVVEAKKSVLERIYSEQESLRELIAGGWLHLSTKDPDSGEIFIFERGTGFILWQTNTKIPPLRDNSSDCYRDKSLPVQPMLIKQPTLMET